jgi:hypothetical protein
MVKLFSMQYGKVEQVDEDSDATLIFQGVNTVKARILTSSWFPWILHLVIVATYITAISIHLPIAKNSSLPSNGMYRSLVSQKSVFLWLTKNIQKTFWARLLFLKNVSSLI